MISAMRSCTARPAAAVFKALRGVRPDARGASNAARRAKANKPSRLCRFVANGIESILAFHPCWQK